MVRLDPTIHGVTRMPAPPGWADLIATHALRHQPYPVDARLKAWHDVLSYGSFCNQVIKNPAGQPCIMSYKGTTKVSQHRHSNYTGFILAPIARMFPNLKPAFGDLMRMRPEPVDGAEWTWACSAQVSDERFTLHVVETRD